MPCSRGHTLLFALVLLAARTAPLPAQGNRLAPRAVAPVAADDSIAAALRGGAARGTARRIAGRHAVLWVQEGALTPDQAARFSAAVDSGIARIVALLDRPLDAVHYDEDTLQLFIADGIGVSHVYAGYAHQAHRRPYLYLDAARVRRGDAPYLHEATHILAWRFGSHSLREGLASWAEAVAIEEGVSTSSGLFGMRSRDVADVRAATLVRDTTVRDVLAAVGRAGTPDPQITSPQRPHAREAYYVLSQSFAGYLVQRAGIAAALAVYEADDSDAAYRRETGHSLEEWRRMWLDALGRRE